MRTKNTDMEDTNKNRNEDRKQDTQDAQSAPKDIPERVWNTYLAAFLEFAPGDRRRFIKSCERQIGRLRSASRWPAGTFI